MKTIIDPDTLTDPEVRWLFTQTLEAFEWAENMTDTQAYVELCDALIREFQQRRRNAQQWALEEK